MNPKEWTSERLYAEGYRRVLAPRSEGSRKRLRGWMHPEGNYVLVRNGYGGFYFLNAKLPWEPNPLIRTTKP